MKSLRATSAKRLFLRGKFIRNLNVSVWIGAGVAGILLVSTLTSNGAEPGTPNTPAGMAVTVTRAKSACFADVVVVEGNLVPRNEVLVRPDREGLQIKEILAEVGANVSSGAALARLSAPNDTQSSIITISAPIGGVVLAAPTVVGVMASARGEPLFRLIGDGDLDLAAEVPAKQASRLSVGLEAKIKIAGVDELTGHVRVVATTIDATTQLGLTRIAIDHNTLLRVGAFARATISFGESCGVSIPMSALLFGPEGSVVQSIRNDRIETRRVSVGLFAQNNIQIREGLAEGDMIIVRAGAFLREGDRVRPVVERQ
jgi:HlyD family secretion protein